MGGHEISARLDRHLLLVPDDFIPERTVALLSSRLSRDLAAQPEWFKFLRAALLHAYRDGQTLLTAPGTTCDRFIQHAAQRFHCRILPVMLSPSGDLANWLTRLPEFDRSPAVYVSPAATEENDGTNSKLNADQALSWLAHEVRILHLRANSRTEQVAHQRLSEGMPGPTGPGPTLFLASSIRLFHPEFLERALARGALVWHVTHVAKQSRKDDETGAVAPTSHSGPILPLIHFEDHGQFLLHCTRAPHGPWPDESNEEYLDRLILGSAGSRSCLDALCRIAAQARLRSRADFNRSQVPVVSWTANRLEEIKQLRVFRPHLTRWDFEPYGVGIRADVLRDQYGARPVIYGTESDYDLLPEQDRPFFQVAQTLTRAGNSIDWRLEKEWRIIGDVEFSSLADDELVYFVPSFTDARSIARLTNHRTIVLNDDSGSEQPKRN